MGRAPIILFLASGLALFVACAAKQPSTAGEFSAPASERQSDKGPRWAFHPLEKEPSVDEVEFEGGVVEVDGAGSRWWKRPNHEPEVSPFGAPEPLAAVMLSGERLAAVGESGAVYFSDHALSPFVEVRTPPERFTMTRRAGSILIAIAEDGSLRRSDDFGRSWKVVRKDRYFVDLGAAGDGTILAFSVPEQWYGSTDGGRKFSLQQLRSQAPRSIDRLSNGELLVSGLYQASVYRRGNLDQASQELLREISRRDRAQYSLPHFALASAAAGGKAVLDENSYFALKPNTGGKPWQLSRGPLDGPLQKTSVSGLENCGAFRFAAAHGRTAVICEERPGEVSSRLKIFRSLASSSEYKLVKKLFRGQLARLKLAVSSTGKLAVTELCSRPEKGCDPTGVTVISLGGDVQQVFLPGVTRPSAVAFDSADRLWVAGHRPKDGHFVVYLERYKGAFGELLDLSREAGFPIVSGEDSRAPQHLLPGELADVTFTVLSSGRGYVAHVNREGRLSAFGATPSGVTALHGAGHRVAALQGDEEVLWESLTGGLSWSKSPLPRDLCSGPASQCQPALVCSLEGCLVGDELARVGWGQTHDGEPPVLPADSNTDPDHAELSGFECQVEEGDWRDLDGLLEVPGVSSAALGDAAWTASLKFPETAALTAISVPFGKTEIEREVLLAPVAGGQNYAFYVSPQVEGVAAVRYQIPKVTAGSSWSTMSGIRAEIVWDSRVANVYGSASIDSAPPISGGLFTGLGMFRAGAPDLMSVAGRGIYFRLGPESSDNPTLFIRGRGKLAQIEQLVTVEYPSGAEARGGWVNDPDAQASRSTEFLRVKGHHAGLLALFNRRVMTLALGLDQQGGAESFRPYLVGLPGGGSIGIAQSVRYAYRGEDLGFISLQVNLDGPGHRAAFIGLDDKEGFSAPIFVPLQQDLADAIVPCSAEQRRQTPRVLAPQVLGTFRRVEVRGATTRPLELRAMNAVLHGTPESPCVAAFDTRDEGRLSLQGDRYSALVFPGGKSWIFRIERRSGGITSTSVRPMSCRHDGTAR